VIPRSRELFGKFWHFKALLHVPSLDVEGCAFSICQIFDGASEAVCLTHSIFVLQVDAEILLSKSLK
jgi:hypothetical protein